MLYSIYCTKTPYFQSPGISWKAQKDQVIIIFYQDFGSKKDRISHLRKVPNKNFSVISKYHLSTNFLAQEKTEFPIFENFKARTFHWSVNVVFHAKENKILLFFENWKIIFLISCNIMQVS